MADFIDRIRRFLAELKRRRVYRVAVVYAAVAFGGLQAVSLLVPSTTLPSWAEPLLVALAILGFPIALVLAWAFEVTPEGVRRTPARESPAPAGGAGGRAGYGVRHLLAVFGAGLLVAAVGYGGYAVFAGNGHGALENGVETGEDVVVVFPFRVSGEDEDLGQGMVDLLTVKLAGSPRYRPVDPRTAVSAWRKATAGGEASREDLLRAARLVGAEKVVDGSVVRSGSELVLSASVVELPRGEATEPLSVRGSPDRLASLVDDLAAQLLALEVGEVERLSSLTSASLPAVRSWVRGRTAFRDARYREAAAHFEDAVLADTSFALAALDLRAAAEWSTGPSERQQELGERLAWAGQGSLTTRDRAMLDVLLGPRYPAPSTAADELEADRRAVDLAPDSPDAWYQLGDDLYHRGELVGVRDALEQAADAFAEALARDSSFAAPLGHLIEVRTRQGDTARVRELTATYLARHPDSEIADFYRWRAAALQADSAVLAAIRTRWDSVSIQSLWRILGYARLDGRGLEDAETVAGILRSRSGPPAERAITRSVLQGYYLDRGRPREATAVQFELGGPRAGGDSPSPAHPVREELVHGAIFWDGDQEAAEAVVRSLEEDLEGGTRAHAPEPTARSRRMRDLCLAAQWWAHEGGRDPEVAEAAYTLRGTTYPDGRTADRERDRHCAALLDVMSADPGRPEETVRRVAVLDSLSLEGPSQEFSARANLASVRALAAAGLQERAVAIAFRRSTGWHEEYVAPRVRWRARLAAALGEDEPAAEAEAHYRALRGEGADGAEAEDEPEPRTDGG